MEFSGKLLAKKDRQEPPLVIGQAVLRGNAVLNVLQLIPTLDRSGAEKQMVLLAKGLPRDRFRVEVAALTRLGPLEVELRGGDSCDLDRQAAED